MKKVYKILSQYLPYFIIITIAFYTFMYFNFLKTPSSDYIGNFRPPVLEYMQGIFPGNYFKVLPFYPLLLALFTKFLNFSGFDPIYYTAITLNYVLIIPYLFLVYKVFCIFLNRKYAIIALIFLGVNGFTIYTAINAELEMVLSLLIVGTLYLNIKKNNIKYITAFFTAITKWDSVFIIPALMFNDFFIDKKKTKALVLGTLSSLGLLFWTLRVLVPGMGSQNPYIGEISRRGPNIYRYIIDTFLVSTGFSQWMATDVYFSHLSIGTKIILFLFIACIIIIIISATITGIISLYNNMRYESFPLLIFYAGFVLIHLIYQNTKSRYVLPVLWLQYLLMFYGFSQVIIPWLKKKFINIKKARISISIPLSLSGILFVLTFVFTFYRLNWPFTIVTSIFTLYVLISLADTAENSKIFYRILCITFLLGVLININFIYSNTMMEHYSLRRVEFKEVALWYKKNYQKNDKMLITETNVPQYYTNFPDDRFYSTKQLKSNSVDLLISELKSKHITLIFIDQFYIDRLLVNDKNAIEKNAELLKKIRDHYLDSKFFTLEKKFKTKKSTESYLLRFKG